MTTTNEEAHFYCSCDGISDSQLDSHVRQAFPLPRQVYDEVPLENQQTDGEVSSFRKSFRRIFTGNNNNKRRSYINIGSIHMPAFRVASSKHNTNDDYEDVEVNT